MIYNKNKGWKQIRHLIKTIMNYTRTSDDNYLRFLHDCRLEIENIECEGITNGFYDFGLLRQIRNGMGELDVHMNHPVFKSYIEDGNELLENLECYRTQIPTGL